MRNGGPVCAFPWSVSCAAAWRWESSPSCRDPPYPRAGMEVDGSGPAGGRGWSGGNAGAARGVGQRSASEPKGSVNGSGARGCREPSRAAETARGRRRRERDRAGAVLAGLLGLGGRAAVAPAGIGAAGEGGAAAGTARGGAPGPGERRRSGRGPLPRRALSERAGNRRQRAAAGAERAPGPGGGGPGAGTRRGRRPQRGTGEPSPARGGRGTSRGAPREQKAPAPESAAAAEPFPEQDAPRGAPLRLGGSADPVRPERSAAPRQAVSTGGDRGVPERGRGVSVGGGRRGRRAKGSGRLLRP